MAATVLFPVTIQESRFYSQRVVNGDSRFAAKIEIEIEVEGQGRRP